MEYGLKKWIEQFAFIFNSPIDEFVLDWKKDTRELVEWFFRIRKSVEEMHFDVHEMSHDDFRIVLNTVKTTKKLKLVTGDYHYSVEWLNGFSHRNSALFDTDTTFFWDLAYGGWTIHDGNGTKATILIKKGISQEQYGITFIVWTKDVSVTLE
uniref:FBA_2 domain-containing protein n=1 Tax=Caenorhabditis tropicalis TaxID=1561998 RepID=A0A1I7TIV7_9PELO